MSELATVSTHVLDVASGKPAAGVRVTLGTRTLTTEFEARLRIDTPKELDYYQHGGILQYVLRQLATASKAA